VNDDLIAFLYARLDEDEAAARAWLPRVRLEGSSSWCDEVDESDLGPYSIEHARLHDPARVLREVEAGRAMVEKYERGRRLWNPDTKNWFSPAAAMFGSDMEWLIRTLAAAWSDHPDYRPEWKP
jgi:hypothetical protein